MEFGISIEFEIVKAVATGRARIASDTGADHRHVAAKRADFVIGLELVRHAAESRRAEFQLVDLIDQCEMMLLKRRSIDNELPHDADQLVETVDRHAKDRAERSSITVTAPTFDRWGRVELWRRRVGNGGHGRDGGVNRRRVVEETIEFTEQPKHHCLQLGHISITADDVVQCVRRRRQRTHALNGELCRAFAQAIEKIFHAMRELRRAEIANRAGGALQDVNGSAQLVNGIAIGSIGV